MGISAIPSAFIDCLVDNLFAPNPLWTLFTARCLLCGSRLSSPELFAKRKRHQACEWAQEYEDE
mgnify:CR=1 FL=1